jgi:phosphopantetheinyl transferase (holo-ACP synthase)
MSRRSTPGTAEVWLATPEAASLFDPSKLDSADRARWAAIQTRRRQVDWASSRALLNAVPNGNDQTRSLSHSHGFAALALVPSAGGVGIDVEWQAPRDFKGMAGIAYSDAERDYLESLENPKDLRATFYLLWTLKEAFAKALGLHLADALRQCCFVDSSGTRRAEVPTTQSWRATVFAPRPQLRLAVVRTHEPAEQFLEPVETMEWPQHRSRAWPVVLDLVSSDNHAGCAW